MTVEEIAAAVLGALSRADVPHMLVGGLSSNFYGIPRNTKDVDIVVEIREPSALDRVGKLLPDGFAFDSQVSFETITGNVRYIVRVEGTPFVVELFQLADDSYQQCRFERRRTVFIPQLDQQICIPTGEDVVVQKLRWGRPKDLEDVRDVLTVQGTNLDSTYIEEWCDRLDITNRLRALLDSMHDP